jgi:hypothetical protein
MSFPRFVAKCLRGSALNLSQLSCLPHETLRHHEKKDTYRQKYVLDFKEIVRYNLNNCLKRMF